MLKSILLPIAAFGVAAAVTTAAAAAPTLGAGSATAASERSVGGVTVRGMAPPDVQVKSKPVRYSDLDLTSPDGARTLFHRIRNTAAEVCDPRPAHLDNLAEYSDYQDFARCELDGINLALTEVNSPALDQYVDGLR